MNVLVYNGPGASEDSVKHAVRTLRHLLEPYYAVSTVSARVLQTEPWAAKTSAIAFPGGADIPYIRECTPVLPLIKKFVSRQGGAFIGFCAGGYFGTSRVEFATGDPNLEVVGARELKFFPGTGRGPAFRGFRYNSEAGARAAKLKTEDGDELCVYYNGGGVFVDADKFDNVEVIATYADPIDVPFSEDPGSPNGAAAAVICKSGNGKVLLTGPHPEFVPHLLQKSLDHHYNDHVVATLLKDDQKRLKFMKDALTKLGLHCNSDFKDVQAPSLTPMLIAAPGQPEKFEELKQNLIHLSNPSNSGYLVLEGENDTFNVYDGLKWFESAQKALVDQEPEEVAKCIILPNTIQDLPNKHITPNFDMAKYFSSLKAKTNIGSILMYGEIITSTSSLLDSNKSLLKCFPQNSLLHVGTIQVSGRGRGGNVWVNPKGVSASTVCINLPMRSPTTNRPVSIVFVQYLAMLAYCRAILGYAPGFEDLPVRIKWPNDLYAMSPDYYHSKKMRLVGKGHHGQKVPLNDMEPAFVKIAGLLVNTSFNNDNYSLLLGCGLNVTHEGPTTSLQAWINILNKEREAAQLEPLPPIEIEKLLAFYMNELNHLVEEFLANGTDRILPEYYKLWLHSDQIVSLMDHQNVRAKLVGITEDYGLLIAKELYPGTNAEYTGTTYHLQPDGNTFDIFRGLISKKAT
ncbi:LAMI_0E11694g1_1 [Lachancea mirantina]|uniref:LAMI_0E11694g1_1 n=1 Tax=Lachancea mirantina TaxID=1230905 RepID=A0A1G4JPV3_9SACH|nr:LAMI_0E11694g1_1 [Lachancea mirantina]